MQILLTNDDGIDAPGLETLAAVARGLGEVTIVAPHQGYSGCGHQVTNHDPITVEQVGERRYKVFGTPADCARLGVTQILPQADWLLSGINLGANLGVDLVMSGTVAAAREATWLGKRAMAISQYVTRDRPRDWTRTAAMTNRVLQLLWCRELSADTLWNVNLPDVDADPLDVPIVDTYPEPRHLDVDFRLEQGGHRFQGNYRDRPRTPGSDVDVCFGGAVSVSGVRSL